MRICADEHVSPRILRAVHEIALPRSCTLCSVRELQLGGSEDEYWIERFASDGGAGILSGDRRMLKRERVVTAIRQTSLVAIFLPSDWAGAKRHFQAAHILFWWPKLQTAYETAPRGSIWVVPRDFGNHALNEHIVKPSKADRARARVSEPA